MAEGRVAGGKKNPLKKKKNQRKPGREGRIKKRNSEGVGEWEINNGLGLRPAREGSVEGGEAALVEWGR